MVFRISVLCCLCVLLSPIQSLAQKKAPASTAAKSTKAVKKGAKDTPREIAVAYLESLEGKRTIKPREYLLGGLTLTAEDFSIPNWKIVKRDEPKVEKAPIADAVKAMRKLEKVSEDSLANFGQPSGDESFASLSQSDAQKLLGPTEAEAKRFQKAFPVFAYSARVGKDVFWHPSNPWRRVIKKLGTQGDYHLELHLFHIEEVSSGGKKRVWPLRVLRIRSEKHDTGWKILPASNWDPEF